MAEANEFAAENENKKQIILFNSKKECCGCGACAQKCPFGAISMVSDEEGFLYPHISKDKCRECGLCRDSCPISHSNDIAPNLQEAYAFQIGNSEALLRSTSGGASYELAREILLGGGVVFGAVYGEDFHVQHQIIRSVDELY